MHSSRYIILFATAVCAVCAIFVAGTATSLKDRQIENAALDVQTKILDLAGLIGEDERLSREEIKQRYADNVVPRLVNLETGQYVEGDATNFDMRAAASDPAQSELAPENAAKVRRVPYQGVVYQIVEDGEIAALILPINGYGLWSYLYGFLALAPDTREIQGITFYEHGETPGLGGEVDNPRWKALWPGRLAFDDQWQPAIEVLKGAAGSVEEAPYHVDGLSGATITSRGVTSLVRFWIGQDGFGPYLASYRTQQGI